MHTIRANLYWEFQFVLGYIAVPRSRILLEPLYGSGVATDAECLVNLKQCNRCRMSSTTPSAPPRFANTSETAIDRIGGSNTNAPSVISPHDVLIGLDAFRSHR